MKILTQLRGGPPPITETPDLAGENLMHDYDSVNRGGSSAGEIPGLGQSQQSLPISGTGDASGKVFCFKHQDKEIEYFCKFCHTIVCPKCMFQDHNGHELAQLEDVTNIIKQNIYDLNKLMLNTKRINDDNRQFIEHIKQEIQRLNDQQSKNIDKGFNELIMKLQERRDELKQTFAEKYIQEENKILAKNQILD